MLDTVALRLKHLLKEPIAWLLITLAFCLSFYSCLPDWFIRGALTVSIILKSLLMFFLPLLILSGTAIAFSSLRGNSLLFIAVLTAMILISNFANLTVSAIGGCCIIPHLAGSGSSDSLPAAAEAIAPFFVFDLPPPLPAVWALVIGVTSGIADTFLDLSRWMKIVRLMRRFAMWFLIKIFIRFLPLFLTGFVLKLLLEGQMSDFL